MRFVDSKKNVEYPQPYAFKIFSFYLFNLIYIITPCVLPPPLCVSSYSFRASATT